MSRFVTCLLLFWSLFAGPALCMGGVLEHACDCGVESDLECSHEDSCADDPCASVATRSGGDERAERDLAPPAVPTAFVAWAREPMRASTSPPAAPEPTDRARLPYAASDRPLRI